MSDIKSRVQGLEASVQARNVQELAEKSTTIYETLAIISSRASNISSQLKKELQAKLEEFSSATDSLEEINENKEQIEISKFYERLPNPATIAMNEFLDDELNFRYKDKDHRN